jgi:hypothetical protein
MLILTDQFDNKTNVKWLEERGTFAGLCGMSKRTRTREKKRKASATRKARRDFSGPEVPRDPRALREAISVTRLNSLKPANACRKIKKSCLPFTTFRLNIGRIYGPPIP